MWRPAQGRSLAVTGPERTGILADPSSKGRALTKVDPEEAGHKWSPALGRGLTEGWVGLRAGLPGALSGSAALVSGRGVPVVVAAAAVAAAAARVCRVSHAGKWPFDPRELLSSARMPCFRVRRCCQGAGRGQSCSHFSVHLPHRSSSFATLRKAAESSVMQNTGLPIALESSRSSPILLCMMGKLRQGSRIENPHRDAGSCPFHLHTPAACRVSREACLCSLPLPTLACFHFSTGPTGYVLSSQPGVPKAQSRV